LGLFDYQNLRIDQALRMIFKSCKIPGEAQVIDRVISNFAHAYYKYSDFIKNESAAYILAFSLIMLNTDLHTPSVKTKMPVESYIRNLLGVNDNENFPEEYLKDLYVSIKSDPIEAKEVIRSIENHDIADMASKWGKILLRSKNTGNYWMLNEFLRQPAGENEKLMFELLWESGLLGTLTSAIECANTSTSISHLRQLTIECSKVSSYFNMKEYIQKLMSVLCQYFCRNTDSVAQLYSTPKAFNILEAAVGSAMVSKNHLSVAWIHLINLVLRLHKLKLLPNQLIELDDFMDEEGNALPMATTSLDETFFQYFRNTTYSPSPSCKSEEEIIEESVGIWASFVKYLGVPTQTQKNNEELLQEMVFEVKEKISSTGLHLLFLNTKTLELDSMNSYLACLLQKCKNETEEVSIVLCIELLTNAVLSNIGRLPENTWRMVLDVLENMICNSLHTWISERGLVNLIRITILHHEEYQEIKNTLEAVLKFMAALELNKFNKFAERLAAGLTILLSQGNAHFLCSGENWESIKKLIQNFVTVNQTIRTGFELFGAFLVYFEKTQELNIQIFEDMLEIPKIYLKSETPEPILIQKSMEFTIKLFKIVEKNFDYTIKCNYWRKVIGELSKLCQHTNNTIRNSSYTILQEAVLGFIQLDSWIIWKECFEKVLFPLVIEPFVITKDMLKGVSEEKAQLLKKEYENSRERATSLVCCTVLNILPIITSTPDFQVFWLRLVKLLAQTLRYKDDVNEKSYELIKNLFLIVKTENIVSEDLWTETWNLIDSEELKSEINS
jgi:Sec7 domain